MNKLLVILSIICMCICMLIFYCKCKMYFLILAVGIPIFLISCIIIYCVKIIIAYDFKSTWQRYKEEKSLK